METEKGRIRDTFYLTAAGGKLAASDRARVEEALAGLGRGRPS